MSLECSEPSPESHDETMTGLSDLDEASPASNDSEALMLGRAMRVLRVVLDEFDIRLGVSNPPEDLLDTVSAFLDKVHLYLDRHSRAGQLVPLNLDALNDSGSDANSGSSLPAGKESSPSETRKRPPPHPNNDGEEDEQDENDDYSGAPVETQKRSSRKRIKAEEDDEFPCPFRKRNPHRFNIRDYEYCARAPFKNMSELK
jgi:hypothetical protein